jgi:hypothetical protein
VYFKDKQGSLVWNENQKAFTLFPFRRFCEISWFPLSPALEVESPEKGGMHDNRDRMEGLQRHGPCG